MEMNEDINNTDDTEAHKTHDIQSDASAEPAHEVPSDASAEPAPEPPSDASAEPAHEVSSDASAEPAHEVSSDASAEPAQEVSADASAEPAQEVSADASAEPAQEVSADASAEPAQEVSADASAEPAHEVSSDASAEPNASAQNDNTFNSFEKVYKIHDNDYYHTRNSGGGDRRNEFFKDRDPTRTNKFRKFDKIEARKLVIDYKKPEILQEFLTEKGRILSRLITGTSAQNQRRLTREVKRARYVGFLPNA